MKASALDSSHGDDADLFGTNTRGYSAGGPSYTKMRPTMISAKYRLKEERRKVLKISVYKLRKIEDPESSLRRSVLINNTMKRLQKEAKEEKLQKQYPRCYSSRSSQELAAPMASVPPALSPPEADKENTSPFRSAPDMTFDHKMDLDDVDAKTVTRLVCHETMDDLVEVTGVSTEDRSEVKNSSATPVSRKRSFEEVEDCDVHDVLSQFYMPPTPRMLTSIDDTDDEDEDVNVVDIDIVSPGDPEQKRPRLNDGELGVVVVEGKPILQQRLCRTLSENVMETEETEDVEVILEDTEDVERRLFLCSGASRSRAEEQDPCWRAHPSEHSDNVAVNPDVRHPHLRFGRGNFEPSCPASSTEKNVLSSANSNSGSIPNNSSSGALLDSTEHQYSCGHSSMFGEIQGVVYHSLITSLES